MPIVSTAASYGIANPFNELLNDMRAAAASVISQIKTALFCVAFCSIAPAEDKLYNSIRTDLRKSSGSQHTK